MSPDVFARLTDALVESHNPATKERLAQAIEGLDAIHAELVNAVVWERVSKREMARRLKVHRPDVDRMLAEAFEDIREFMGWTTDAYYEAKKARGLLQETSAYLSEDEARSTLVGRSRGDGRRLDSYCSDDPVQWEGIA